MTQSAWRPSTGEFVLASAALSLHRLHFAPPQRRHLTVSVFSHSRGLTGELMAELSLRVKQLTNWRVK